MTCWSPRNARFGLSAAAVLLASAGAMAQPANDNCASAEVVTGGSPVGFDTTQATTDGAANCGFNSGFEVWYAYTAPSSGTAVFSTCGSAFDTVLSILDGCGGTELACNDDACGLQSQINFAVTQGVTYIVRVAGYNGQTGTGTFQVTDPLTGGVPNDNCADAITLTGAGTENFSTLGASNDFAGTCGASGASPDIWYRYVPSGDGSATFETCGSGYDTVLSAHDGCGGNVLVCNDDACGLQSRVSVQTTNGVPIWIRVSGFNNASGTGVLTYSEVTTVPPGEFCTNAIDVVAGTHNFDTTGLTPDIGSGCPGNGSASQWFRYTPAGTGTANVTTCGLAFFDTVLVAYSACDAGTQIACNDDSCGLQSSISFPITEAQPVFIRISGFGAAQGAGQFQIDEITTPPANDDCANAIVVTDGTTNFNNFAATNDGAGASCGFGGEPGSADVWFSYTATLDGNGIIDTCGSSYDTLITIFDTCGGIEIACNDDSCGLQSSVTFPITNGTTYLVRVAGFEGAAGNGVLNVIGLPPIANDDCANAIAVLEGSTPFNNFGANTDGPAATCGFGADPGSNDVWFTWTAPAESPVLATIDTCGSGLDTLLTVLDACGGTQVACNDDSCGLQSRVNFVTTPGATYTIRVAGWNGAQGNGTLNVAFGDIPQPCLTQPDGSIEEGELCGEDNNGGCNSPGGVPQYTMLPSEGAVVWGNAWADANFRDTDWFRIDLPNGARLSAALQTEFPAVLFFISGECATGITVFANAATTGCDGGPATLTADLAPGSYTIFVGQSRFVDGPCGFRNNYILSVETGATGACCNGNACTVTTAADCSAQGGQYRGDGTGCGGANYSFNLTQEPVIDITGTGTILGTASNCDDCGEIVSIGFDFAFFGTTFTDVGISSNGYMNFGGGPLGDFSNDPIPAAATPNNIICPAWDDYNTATAGDIFVQTEGDAPNRRFIVLWSNVSEFAANNSNTFQAILYEGTNRIEFRYGDQRPIVAGDVTIGVENADGTIGFAYDSTTINSGDMLTVSPSTIAGACSCRADLNGDGVLNPDDLSDAIGCFFSAGCTLDYNNDTLEDPDDLSDYIADYFDLSNGCPR